jgi:hypothetical protein
MRIFPEDEGKEGLRREQSFWRIKSLRATSRVRWPKKPDVSKAVSVVIRKLMSAKLTMSHITHGLSSVDILVPRQRQRIFPLTSVSRPALGPTQPPVQWVPGALSPGVKRGRGVMLTTHHPIVPRLRKSRS